MPELWIVPEKPALVLAPMEGVTDFPMRALLTERGGFSYCVSEFIRVSQEVLPSSVFVECVPELMTSGKTETGIPVQVQLLGGNEARMARSAVHACEAGAQAIDLNFGCPAPTVNRHDGGASLLRYPERIQSIVAAVRDSVPREISVSAKLRLGWESIDDILVNAEQAILGGASWLTIHARTKVQGYAPPAYWKMIGEVKRRFDIPVIANGEIWTYEDFLKCREESQCQHFMIGRGALADPALPHRIARELGLTSGVKPFEREKTADWEAIFRRFAELCEQVSPSSRSRYALRRIKQWLKFANMRQPIFQNASLLRAESLDEIFSILRPNRDCLR